MKNIRIFYMKNCHFLVVKFSVYLNRRVFVMIAFHSTARVFCMISDPVTANVFLKHFCFNPSVIITISLSFLLKTQVFSITTYPFTRHRSLYVPAINKMPSFCAMAKECDLHVFSFELHSNRPMLSLHRNGGVFNQRFVIFPRTGVLHACLSPKRQNLTILASGEKCYFVPYSLKGLQFQSDYLED